MLRKLIATRNDYAILLVRLALAVVMFPHGAQKTLGWFGGYGFHGTLQFFTGKLGIPAPLAVLVFLAESLGAVALAFGFVGRFMAFGVAATMAGAVWMVHLHNGFFMNWTGQQAGEGIEYHILVMAMALAIMIRGSGALSLDRLLQRRLETSSPEGATPSARPTVA
jgi:putative oxidoreductase